MMCPSVIRSEYSTRICCTQMWRGHLFAIIVGYIDDAYVDDDFVEIRDENGETCIVDGK